MILVTGHKGFIGSRLFRKIDAIGIDLQEGHNLLTCDLPEVDTIYHLAAQSSVEASWTDPVHDADNLRMTIRLAQNYPKAKIIFANSAAGQKPVSSPYGFSKYASAEYLRLFHHNSVICTFPNVYGPGSRSVVDIFKSQERITIFGDGEQTRDYVHVDDIIKGLLKAKNWSPGEYFMGSGVSTNVLQLAEGKIAYFAPARKEARESLIPNTTPDWNPTINVQEYLNDY